jgi:hypothetical protein
MKTIRTQTRIASFMVAILLLLNISPALAGGLDETADKGKFRGRVEVIFTKWVTDYPNMAGVVSGGLFVGEILNVEPTTAGAKIEALYHINGGAFHFTAHNFITQDNLKGTAVINGVVTDGPLISISSSANWTEK